MRRTVLVLAVFAALAAAGSTNAYVIDQGGADCWGWYGNSSNETMPGSSNPDCMYGGGGDDWLYGGAGADQIFGNGGYDHLFGGTEVDYIYGGLGIDMANGGNNNDILYMDDGQMDLDIDCGAGADDTVYIDLYDNFIYGCEHIILQLSPQHTF